ncbi:MAG: DUF3857 domain-containing protein [Candidatus Fermentibacteraceae bacterium]|nr:DUF3857 domain-containing protein [Candidatus Fermentibacteraceae bacterium]
MLFILAIMLASPDAVYLNHDVTLYCSSPDSGYSEVTREVIIPLTARGVEHYRELVSSFRNTWESLEISIAEIRHWRPGRGTDDAVLRETPHRSLLPDGRLESSLRELFVEFPGIEIGDTLIIEIRRYIDYLPMDDFYSYTYFAAARDSISAGTFRVFWPADREIHISTDDLPQPEITLFNDTTVCYLWSTYSYGPIAALPFSQNTAECSPAVTIASHLPVEVSAGLFTVLDETLMQDYEPAADSILKITGYEPVNISRWVSGEIEYLSGNWGRDPGYTPRFPVVTLNEHAGVCRDKAVLLLWLLRRAGHDPYAILTSTSGSIRELVGSRSFDHMLVALDVNTNEVMFLDPVNRFSEDGYSYTLRGAEYLPLTASGSELKIFPDKYNLDSLSIQIRGTFDADSGMIHGNINVTMSGAADELFRSMFAGVALDSRTLLLETLFGVLPGSDIHLDGDPNMTSQPLFVHGSGSWDCSYIRKDDSFYILIPGLETFDLVGSRASAYVLPDIRDNVFIETPYNAHLRLDLTGLPSGSPEIPEPHSSINYSIEINYIDEYLRMDEFMSLMPMIPDSSQLVDLRSGLLSRMSGYFRTVVFR